MPNARLSAFPSRSGRGLLSAVLLALVVSTHGLKFQGPSANRRSSASKRNSPTLQLPQFLGGPPSPPSSRPRPRPRAASRRRGRGRPTDGSPRLPLDQIGPWLRDRRDEARPAQILSGFALAVFVLGGTVSAGGSALGEYLSEEGRRDVLERTVLFGTILENVKAAYVDRDVDVDKLFQTGVNAMLGSLDPYSSYENAVQSEDLSVRTKGRYGGVGLTIGRDGDETVVLGALEGFAYDAGMRPGDIILSVDGVDAKGLTVSQVKDRLRGEPGTSVALAVRRDGSPEAQLAFTLPRKIVRLRDIPLATEMRDGVGYLKLDAFSEGTAEEVATAIRRLQKSEPLRALVLDLRDNPGGLLEAAVSVSQQLVPKGTEIVSTAGRVYGDETSISYRSTQPPLLAPTTRLVVLINGNTASAAEIVSGVVQDVDRGVLVGERSFGKGLVQVVEPLPGNAALKLTVAKYYTPSGRCIQALSYSGGRNAAAAAKGADGAAAADGKAAPDGAKAPAPAPVDDEDEDELGEERAAAPFASKAVKEEEKKVFLTRAGRKVKDGGGIAPDVEAASRPLGDLEITLLRKGLFFRYASEWLQAHPGTAAAQQQALASASGRDAVYRDFKRFVAAENAKGGGAQLEDRLLRKKFEDLEKTLVERQDRAAGKVKRDDGATAKTTTAAAAGASGGAGPRSQAQAQLAALRSSVQAEQMRQLDSQRKTLEQDVVDSVLARLTPPSERLRDALSDDPQVAAALAVAQDASRYEALLAAPKDAQILTAAVFPNEAAPPDAPVGLPPNVRSE